MPYLGIFYVFSFWGVYLKGFVLFVSPLIGCTGRSILHCEFSTTLIVPCIPLSVHTRHGQRHLCLPHCATTSTAKRRPRGACPCIRHLVQGRSVEGLRPLVALSHPLSSCFPRYRYCNEHLLCPPHMFWTGWGPWERCTAQCGGGIQARRRTCENGPDCAGCNMVSTARSLQLGGQSQHMLDVLLPRCPEHTRCTANTKSLYILSVLHAPGALHILGALHTPGALHTLGSLHTLGARHSLGT